MPSGNILSAKVSIQKQRNKIEDQ